MNLKKSNNLKENKMFIYSAHDVTLVNVWRTLGFAEMLKPEYGASLLFELHSVQAEYQVKVCIFSVLIQLLHQVNVKTYICNLQL